jgi:cytochrome b6
MTSTSTGAEHATGDGGPAAAGRDGGLLSRAHAWLDARYDLSAIESFARHKTVPVHRQSIWYYFGGVAVFFFVVQVLSGALLLVYYRADIDVAFESIQHLMSHVKFGWLVRSVHVWSANLMVLAVFVHMFSVFFMKTYRRPRELTWVSGVLLLVLVLGFGFSGYLLPWNEISLFATKVGTDMVGAVPMIGTFALKLLRGSEAVTGATLSRFFALHIAILPAIFTLILAGHLLFIQRQGMSQEHPGTRSMRFVPDFLLRELLLWLIVLDVLAVLAVTLPGELGHKADLLASAPAGIKPEWYFLAMFETLKLIPAHVGPLEGEVVGIVGFGLLGIAWGALPFYDRSDRWWGSRWLRVVVVLGLVYALAMTVKGILT